MLGGGGLVAANVYASATESGWGGQNGPDATGQVKSAGMATIDCPDVGSRLTNVPDGARADVDRELAELDRQTASAYQQLQASAQALSENPHAADDSVMNPLKDERSATIERIAVAIDRVGDRPEGLESLAACALLPGQEGTGGGTGGTGQATATASASPGGGQGQSGAGQAGAGQGGNGPVASDYADITAVQPNAPQPAQQADASRGSFTSDCGVNANGLRNSDNVIVAPGVSNGAHHFHDYVGNQSNNAFASDGDLAKADTSCVDKGDRSTYYWPVLRLQNGKQERDAGAPGGGTEGNAGQIVTPKQVTLTFVGNPRSKVTEMPRLLRIITGDAKAFVNGPANANASWSCTGYEDRQLKDKYPLCPSGSDVVRTFRFQSCWDGRNTDSANHRTHVAFAGPDGSCPEGFRAIPQLVQRIVYDVPAPSIEDGGRTVPLFAVDSFPEQLHKPVTDHGDFINVFDESLMRHMVDCINSGRTCGAGADGGGASASPGTGSGSGSGSGSGTGSGTGTGSGSGSGTGSGTGTGSGATAEPTAGASATPAPSVSNPSELPRTDATTTPAHTTKHGAPSKPGNQDGRSEQGTHDTGRPAKQGGQGTHGAQTAPAKTGTSHSSAPSRSAAPSASEAGEIGQATRSPEPGSGRTTPPPAQSEPQAVHGGLAETGANLWPAGLGTLLALSGLVMLIRAKRLRY
ncbi:hypothetical protein AQJ66_28700 [Streptomyces bungoensis]|uniref:DUF1996 domain-containing protein n=1 Tax=Streptomyces bungoensis TaxID=285568 RepID=A0A117RA01_9ACTN|nr:DUF1996 domain-containing protein [Streptomyces bungoensis]KUN79351.1 hypothetical protein AQJ66_28700 [Streptomyces bungoensis]